MIKNTTIDIFVYICGNGTAMVTVPLNIDDEELKAILRDEGLVPSSKKAYNNSELYFFNEDGDEIPICNHEYKMLEDIGIKDKSRIYIIPG